MASKMWGGRFAKKTDPQFERFSASFRHDVRLLPYDLEIDLAHVKALAKAKILSASEAARLTRALEGLKADYRRGALRLDRASEDVHSALQLKLCERLGPLADKIHTARSRNDLVSQSSRLYCLDRVRQLIDLTRKLQTAVVASAERTQAVIVPAMTHLQSAQAVSYAHILLAYVEMLQRSVERFKALERSLGVCVLGSGAVAGVTFALDQRLIARLLGLRSVTDNSYDVSGDRDYILDLLYGIFALSLSLSRIAEDLLIGQTKPFNLIDPDESFCTGSSMMPQKKNADFLELVRGFGAVAGGHFVSMAMTLKGLPTSYNRDLQWDKAPLFESTELCLEILQMSERFMRHLRIRPESAKALLADETLYATDLADYLVRKGVAFKEAHHMTGLIVRLSEEEGLPMSKIGLDRIRALAPAAGGDLYKLFDAEHSVRLKKTQGSTHPQKVRVCIRRWKLRLKK